MSTLTRRRPARRRRRYRNYALGRSFTFGPGAVAPLGGWLYLHEPLRWAGLAAMGAAGLLIVPALIVFVLFCLPALLTGGLVPRQWRINHRARHGRENCKSAYISASLRRIVMAADRHRCLYCGITDRELAMLSHVVGRDGRLVPRRLHVDHYRPWQPGFLTTFVNLNVLCDEHNEIKLNYYRQRNGYLWYRPDMRTPQRVAMAAEITRAIRWRRWSLLRLLRAAWALG